VVREPLKIFGGAFRYLKAASTNTKAEPTKITTGESKIASHPNDTSKKTAASAAPTI
jgi:hypothetical protein